MTREEREKAIKEFQQIVESAEWVDSSTADRVSVDSIKCAIEALQRCQEIDNKFANATNTDWVRKGFTDAEVKDICDDARKALQKQLKESTENFNKNSAPEFMLNADLISRQVESCEDAIRRKNCKYRHENGNCLAVGGFCLAVDDKHCQLKNSESCGKDINVPATDAISRHTEEYTEFEILKLGEGIIPYIKCKSCDGMNGMLANFCPWCGRRWKK